jgi:tRNA A-37 threonylcarbamoyl transferase component Bud32
MTSQGRADEIIGAWLQQKDQGEAPDPEEVIRAHPELADELRTRFEALLVLDHLFAAQAIEADHPTEIGSYRIIRELGRGGMGIVYEAEQPDLERRVALKLLSPRITNDAEAVARFYREAKATARLDHPNIVAVHEIGRDKAFLYYTMEFVDGRSLHEVFEERRRADRPVEGEEQEYFRWLAKVFVGAAHGLRAAHEGTVIHRDIKPSNVLLTPDDVPKLVDFGLARIGGAAETLTEIGTVIGTLQYMSPEQATAEREQIDERTDVYSLGATLYEGLTLEWPFRAEDPVEMISHIIADQPARPRKVNPQVPKDLETITLKAMAKERRRRYQSAADFAADLERFLRSETIVAKRPGPVEQTVAWALRRPVRVLAAALLIVIVASGALFLALLPPDGLAPPDLGRTAGEFARALGLDLESAGIARELKVIDWVNFARPSEKSGTVLAFLEHVTGRVDLGAFDAEGEFLWSASRNWPDYSTTLGQPIRGLVDLQTLVTRRSAEGPVEDLSVAFSRGHQLWLILADPRTGTVRGTWDDSELKLANALEGYATVVPLPTSSDGPRRLLLGGLAGKRQEARPYLVVLGLDGQVHQRIVLPVLGRGTADDAAIHDIRANWSEEDPEVILGTGEGAYFSLLVKEGRLDVSSARAMLSDNAARAIDDEARAGWPTQDPQGYAAYLANLARGVRELP